MNFSSEVSNIPETELFEYAAKYADLIMPTSQISARNEAEKLAKAVREICRSAKEAEALLAESEGRSIAARWLTDNLYMVKRQGKTAEQSLRSSLRLRAYCERAMVYELCAGLAKSGAGKVTAKRLEIFLDGFQSVTVLNQREIAMIPDMLTAAVISAIGDVCADRDEEDDAGRAKLFEALFTSLRFLAHVDLGEILEKTNAVNTVLSSEHTGIYSRMDNDTRKRYLRAVEKKAIRADKDEITLARELVERSRQENIHVGFLLLDETKPRGGVYIGLNILITLLLSLLAAFELNSPLTGILLLIPVSELVKAVIDLFAVCFSRPERMPRLDMSAGIPAEGKTVCVISSLLSGEEEADRMCEKLERLRLASRSEGEELLFGVLADFKEASTPKTGDDERIFARAFKKIDALNEEYGGGFYLFLRQREFNGQKYSGRERKRGAMEELSTLLCTGESKLTVVGDMEKLLGTRYILTLDADTEIYPGSIGQMVGAMLHPLNKPVIDHEKKAVVGGHGIIQPRISTSLESAGRTDFAVIFSGGGGSDPYGSLCGEMYMDTFSSGGFSGKGIIDAEALLECTSERLKNKGVLSHDALEGAFLRGAYMGDTEFYDDFPANTAAYYKRMHRWVRGDWQNLRWVFAKEIAPIERFRLFDSLRRSLVAPATLIAIMCGLIFLHFESLSAWTALIALTSEIVFALINLIGKPGNRHRLRQCTRALTGVGGAIVRCFMRLWFLPFEAWVCLSAACTALWRSLVSHKGLLEWETQAQSDKRLSGLRSTVSRMKIPMLIGAFVLAFSRVVIGRSAGIMWLLSPAAAWAMSLSSYKTVTLSRPDRAFLTSAAEDTWRYFSIFSKPEDNYLPPDNYQEQPPMGLSHTASPTNIGLSMASAVAACDLKIISVEEACEFISRIVLTLERMPRHMGHFYNWYDTRSLLPLHPAFISTVDSGNMYASMVVVSGFLEENGREKLKGRLDVFMDEMDFKPLYDEKRGLFHICYNTAKETPAGGWYDLMASEAMLTSYIAVAKGDVNVSHWRKLSRAQVQKDGYRGLVSWTGTMFEYLMSVLFLPIYRGSLIYESCKFCLYAQRKRVGAAMPWGISESAFFALDNHLRYRYKANGCAALALKRGQDRELVISPYSSFLSLAVDAPAAVKNLRRLEKYNTRGHFGFIEALDFSPDRNPAGERVQCYMVHHQAMSLLAAANTLCDGSISKRFMDEREMSAYSALLKERIPEDGGVISVENEDRTEAVKRRYQWQKTGTANESGYCVLSNGAYTLTLDERGERRASFGGVLISDERYDGMSLKLKMTERSYAILPRTHNLWEMSENRVSYSDETPFTHIKTTVFTPEGTAGAVYEVMISTEKNLTAELELSFRPILAPEDDFSSQPSFWKLGIAAETANNTLILRRISKGTEDDVFLAVSCCENGRSSADMNGTVGTLTEPFVKYAVPLRIRKDETASVRFSVCISTGKSDAISEAERLAHDTQLREGSMLSAVSTYLGMTEAQIGGTMSIAERIDKGRIKNAPTKSELWKLGISGDFPIISCEAAAPEAEEMLRQFCALKSCGIESELVFITASNGEYRDPQRERIEKYLRKIDLEPLLSSPGGVYIVGTENGDIIKARSVYYPGIAPLNSRPIPEPFEKLRNLKPIRPEYKSENGRFIFNTLGGLPKRPWQNILTNGHFGYIATERGSGYMFLENAREMRVNNPGALPESVCGSEQLWAERGGEKMSLFAMPDGADCIVSFEPGIVSWSKNIFDRDVTLTAYVTEDKNVRVLQLKGAEGLDIYWRIETVIGSKKGESVVCSAEDGSFTASNPESFIEGAVFHACTDQKTKIRCDYSSAGMLMGFKAEKTALLLCGFEDAETFEELKSVSAEDGIKAVREYWKKRLSGVKLHTGNKMIDDYVNRWAAYQTIAGRLEGRGSIYQSGGAIGFRDQLQDAVNLILLDRNYARRQILLCCAHQYTQGDVMHWWHAHPNGDRGIRSRCSDDLLWLVWALCEYTEKTGDTDICFENQCYVNSMPLADGEKDRYEVPERSEESTSVLEHCARAIECCEKRGFGEHGLPLMLTGDWNDSMNRVRGESVWLGWFLCYCSLKFSKLCERLKRPFEHYLELSQSMREACERSFNGRWYERGYSQGMDIAADGRRIDSICQSWSVFCNAEHADTALEYAISRLYDSKSGLIKLIDPPYSADEPRVGYITGYGEGCRENGGQYTHAALWLAMACFVSGRTDAGYELMCELINSPHSQAYGAEPFVLPADITAAPGHVGEAGWTWYTGSAGWFYRIATEYMMGIKLQNGEISLSGNIPLALDGAQIELPN